jgi:hypothetical protein
MSVKKDEQPRSRPLPAQNLRFVIANDLDQFRDRSTMRSNRSHVMHNHLTEKRASSGQSPKPDATSRVRKARNRSSTPTRTASPANSTTEKPRLERSKSERLDVMSSAEAIAIYRRSTDPKHRVRRKTTTSIASNGSTRASPAQSRSETTSLGTPPDTSGGSPPFVLSNYAAPLDILALQELESIGYMQTIATELQHDYAFENHRGSIDALRDHSESNPRGKRFGRLADAPFPAVNIGQTTGGVFRVVSYSNDDRMNFIGAMSLAAYDVTFTPPQSRTAAACDAAFTEAMQILQKSFTCPVTRISDTTVLAVQFLILRATLQGDPVLAAVHEDGLRCMLTMRASLDDMWEGARIPLLL